MKDNPDYWCRLLTDCEPGCLPERDVWDAVNAYDVSVHESAVALQLTDCAADVFFATVFGCALTLFTARDDIVFGVESPNGPFPFRFQPNGENGIKALLDDAQAQYRNGLSSCGDARPVLPEGFDLSAEPRFVFGNAAPCDTLPLALCVRAVSEGNYSVEVRYDGSYYSDAWAQSFLRTYLLLAAEWASNDALDQIDLVSPEDRMLLNAANETDVARDTANVVEQFRRAAKQYPENVAVVAGGTRYTYAEVDRITDALAGRLRRMGVKRGSVVSVLIPRDEYMVLATLGVLKTGAAYQPLDPNYPESRLRFMMEDASACLLIADRALVGKVPARTCPVLFTDTIPSLPSCEPFDADIKPGDTYILLYTSGTTGTPKGVMLMHRNIAAFVGWAHDYYEITSESRVAAYASYGFDAHMLDLYPTLTAGATLYIVPEDIRLDLGAIARYYEENGITNSLITTQVGRQFAMLYEGASLKHLSVGGETLVPVDPSSFRFTLHNAYGPTECTILVTVQDVDRLYHRVPIGKACENVKLYVTDRFGRRLPPYAPGELWIAGKRVGKGYLNRPDKTAESFLKNPFDDADGYDRVYRTGDVVRMLPDGTVDFIGRNDGQVKIRGFRIELSEVEGVIREYPGIRDATVQAFSDERNGMKYLVAYVVSDQTVSVDELNAFIRARKPAYMVPSATMQLDAIPLTQNQKVNKRALPLPKREETDRTAPENEAQQKAFDCAADAIGHHDFGIDTDLENAGLSSIGLMRLNVLLSKAFNCIVRTSDVKDLHTVRELAAYLSGAAETAKDYGLRDRYPLSGVQQGILVECMANPNSTIYNIPLLLKLDPAVDLKRLKAALAAAIDAHPYLKMRLVSDENGNVSALRRDDEAPIIEQIDASSLVMGFAGLVRPFKLTEERLYRALLITGGDAPYLFIDAHHILFDGESLTIFTADVERAFRGETLEKERFTGFEAALAEEELRESPAYEAAHAYWAKLLDGLDVDCLPVRDKNGAVADVGLLSYEVRANRDLVQRFLSDHKTTINAVWNAAFGLVLRKFLARSNCVYTTVYNGRSDSRLSESVGMFVHTLPVVLAAVPDETGAAYAQRVGSQLRSGMSNDVFSFAEIAREFGVKADILLVYEGAIAGDTVLGGKPAETVMMPPDTVKAPFTFFIFDTPEGYRIDCEYEAQHYEQWHVRSIAEAMALAFNGIVANETVDSISLVTPEQRAMLDRFNDTAVDYERTDLVTLFRRIAKKAPERIAAIYRDVRLTYGEVDAISDRIAAYAQSLGIGCGDVVSILIPRSEFMVTATFGVMKSGAAYQPLDPSYPSERLSYMIRDANAKLLIADESLLHLLPDYDGPVLKCSEIASLPDAVPAASGLTPDDLLILLYTSGTTGVPKGVMLTHGNLVNFCDWYRRHYDLTAESIVGAYASYGFDACMMDLYAPLTTGAAVCIVPEEIRIDLPVLNDYYEANHVTHVFMTTQMGRMFADALPKAHLRHLSVGGEKLVPIAPPEGYVLTNIYGPTECTVCATTQAVDRLYDRIPIGDALDNYKLFVADSAGNELPVGAMGELYISGHGVSKGYLNQPERTQQSFVKNPFCAEPGYERAFRTGDVVRRLPDGKLDFIGRNDGQVKIRGFRIELAEVEGVIRDYPGIKDVTVQAFDDETFGGKFIAAYVVSDAAIETASLNAFIRSKKPPYMVPSVTMQLDAIPLTQNQKVNRRALPKPERIEESRAYEAPRTPLERELCDEYASILGLEKVSATDSFFEIGGTSISAAKVVMFAMNKGYSIVYKDVFDNPSPRELARIISGIRELDRSTAASDYDYTALNELLRVNCMERVDEIVPGPVGDVILTGATGFLGIHVLKAYLDRTVGKITCLVRRGRFRSPERRMMNMLMYYFGDTFENLFGTRIFCVEGDITDLKSLEALDAEKAATVINCAACVKHFVNDDILDRINFHGVENLVEMCLRSGKRLVHVSTLSVGGEMDVSEMRMLHENELYFGQRVDNDYVRTKFLAERAILESVQSRRLDAVIIRVGNLMSRYTDGEFQINFLTNAFMRSLWAYTKLGQCPITVLDHPVEFSPIDSTATAVLTLAGVKGPFSVFHANNDHLVTMADVIEAMRRHGFKIDTVSEARFESTLAEAAKRDSESEAVISLVAYLNKEGASIREVGADHRFTVNALYRCGFKWPIIDDSYLEKSIWALDSLGFFR